MDRREFNKGMLTAGTLATLPLSLIRLAFADSQDDFTFAYISDAHIQHIKGTLFVRRWDQGLKAAVSEANLLYPKPDFVVFGGDLAQLGSQPELDHGGEILSALNYKTYHVMGEHDYYLDLGEYWEKLYGPPYYSFDHKGVHFVALNSVLTYDEWTFDRWKSPEQRMQAMAGLDHLHGSPFMVGDKQRKWLQQDLENLTADTPIVVLSHAPLQKIYRNWNFWTEDADEVQKLLMPFKKVSVLYGHVHQIQHHQIGNIAFHSVTSTAWPWPYAQPHAQTDRHLPVLTVPMNHANLFQVPDATSWQLININSGRVTARLAELKRPPL